MGSPKKLVLGIFNIALRLTDRHVFTSQLVERFQYCNFETDFLENENLFQKTGVALFS